MPNSPESPRQILGKAVFQDVFRRIDFHAELLRRIKASLPSPLAMHCRYCVAQEDGGVVLYTDSQAFASQLRFMAPALLAALNTGDDFVVKQIQIRNLLSSTPEAIDKPMAPMQTPSSETIAMVKASSQSAACDELAQSLARLGAAMERYAAQKQ